MRKTLFEPSAQIRGRTSLALDAVHAYKKNADNHAGVAIALLGS